MSTQFKLNGPLSIFFIESEVVTDEVRDPVQRIIFFEERFGPCGYEVGQEHEEDGSYDLLKVTRVEKVATVEREDLAEELRKAHSEFVTV